MKNYQMLSASDVKEDYQFLATMTTFGKFTFALDAKKMTKKQIHWSKFGANKS